jgi:hypothetical protein
MRIYTSLTDAQIERFLRATPTLKEQVTTIYSDEGIYEIKTKIHKVFVHDAPCETVVSGDRHLRVDPSPRTYQERWQIPLPHNAETLIVSTYLLPNLKLVFEQGSRTTYYFEAASCNEVIDALKKIEDSSP